MRPSRGGGSGRRAPTPAMHAPEGTGREKTMRDYRYDPVHLRSADPDATARFFETMFGAKVSRDVYPPGTLYPGQPRVAMSLGGQTVLLAPPHPHEPTAP